MNDHSPRLEGRRRGVHPIGRSRRRLALSIGLVVLVGPLSFVGVGRAMAEQGAPASDPLASYKQQPVVWTACDGDDLDVIEGLQCAEIKAPLDYRDPAGPAITVAISRIATSAPDKRRGVLLSNPGGPGGPGLDMPGQLRDRLPVAARQLYDIVGMDPRGTGRSTPLRCQLEGKLSWFAKSMPVSYDPATFDTVVAKSRAIADTCARNIGPRMAHFTTANTARDMDLIRSVLDAPKISYFGVSYGTYLGAVYTQLFPQRVDRVVLDSALVPDWGGGYRVLGEVADRAFQRWAAWAARHDDTYHLGGTPEQVSKTFFNLVHKIEMQPLENLDPGKIRWQMRGAMYDVKRGSEYVVNLRHAVQTAQPLSGPVREPDPEPLSPADDAFSTLDMVNRCGDGWSWSRDVDQYRRNAIAAKLASSMVGDHVANVTPCAFWAYPAPEPPVTVDNQVGALIVQNAWDPNTPLEGAQAMHQALKGSRMITVLNGQRHVVYDEKGDPCALDVVNAYLTTGQLPATDPTCTAPVPTP